MFICFTTNGRARVKADAVAGLLRLTNDILLSYASCSIKLRNDPSTLSGVRYQLRKEDLQDKGPFLFLKDRQRVGDSPGLAAAYWLRNHILSCRSSARLVPFKTLLKNAI
ncbi:hypothetical protein EVAR_57972_1 [Eumeta japonica]|uniref:Uncharacterized protein n=1 Tax=Eumeta variegata TaxID=151549 RepID=A0A4C1XWM6_EUMVA|nr:hypothetical protein EVAR_57972_1 [Eumeta japonica]